MIPPEQIKAMLLKAGVKNLQEYGYGAVTDKNITKDAIYAQFFLSMLEENKGRSPDVDTVIDQLISEIKDTGE